MPTGNFEILHALKCVLGMHTVHTFKSPSLFSSFRKVDCALVT